MSISKKICTYLLKLIFFIDKKIEKIDIIFDIENLLWKSDFL